MGRYVFYTHGFDNSKLPAGKALIEASGIAKVMHAGSGMLVVEVAEADLDRLVSTMIGWKYSREVKYKHGPARPRLSRATQ